MKACATGRTRVGDMANAKRYRQAGIVAVVLALAACALAVEKPTSPPKTCVTEECHADYGEKAYVHGPVGLGDCKSCHEAVDPNAHTYTLARVFEETEKADAR